MRFGKRRTDLRGIADAELAAMLRNGGEDSEQAFKELYRRHAARVHAYCYKILEHREEAEDVFQETFIRFYRCTREKGELTNVPGFLLRIARNLCLNRRRDHTPLESLEGLEIPVPAGNLFEREELLRLIATAVELLESEYREAFVLREYENMSYESIAELTGTTPTNAKSRVFRARQKIRSILEPNIRELR